MRIASLLLLSLGLGFIATVAVAWGLAAWLPQKGAGWEKRQIYDPSRDDFSCLVMMSEYRRVAAVRRAWNVVYPAVHRIVLPFRDAIADPLEVGGHAPHLHGSSWGRAPAVLAEPRSSPQDGCDHATGWPALAGWYGMSRTVSSSGGTQFDFLGGVELPRPASAPGYPFLGSWYEAWKLRALPLRPIWRGLAIDTAFYAGVSFLFLRGAAAARRAHRRRRARCTRCAYDLTGLQPGAPCPECGAAAVGADTLKV